MTTSADLSQTTIIEHDHDQFMQQQLVHREMSRIERAMLIQAFSRKRGWERMKEFVVDGIAWWVFDRQMLWSEVSATSFDEWLADPENKIGHSVNYGHDCVQSVDLFHKFFKIKASMMFGVGWRKFQIINPQVEMLRNDVIEAQNMAFDARRVYEIAQKNAQRMLDEGVTPLDVQQQLNHLEHIATDTQRKAMQKFDACRAKAMNWLIDAKGMSVRDLKNEIAGDEDNGGWTTFFSSPVQIQTLKEMSAVELMKFFGIADLHDEFTVMIDIKGRE